MMTEEGRMAQNRTFDLPIAQTVIALPCFFPSVSSLKTHLMPVDYVVLLAKIRPEKRLPLERLRRRILSAAPGAEECVSYRLPAFRIGRHEETLRVLHVQRRIP